ncbi:unnamed protein product [Linum tenue]|uniref:Uncharacterized protein n=1 Tax=Linum tenue TaxID=586396 RepID=A0AAV0H6Y8_9ROSI|nr:unnamed protein product [Linum tenue]
MSGFAVYDQNQRHVCRNYICDQWRTEKDPFAWMESHQPTISIKGMERGLIIGQFNLRLMKPTHEMSTTTKPLKPESQSDVEGTPSAPLNANKREPGLLIPAPNNNEKLLAGTSL